MLNNLHIIISSKKDKENTVNANNKSYAGICGFGTQEKVIKDQVRDQETHLPRVARQLIKTVLAIVGLIFLAQLFKGYFHSEVFGGIFESTAVMTFLISHILIFAKRMPPEEEKEFLKNHPLDSIEREESIETDPAYSSYSWNAWHIDE